MKKILSIILLGVTIFSSAQKKSSFKEKHNQFSPEQRAILRTKQMTLQLNLSSSQQAQILALNKKQAKTIKESSQKLSQEGKFNMKSKILDKKLAHQTEIKKILNEKQFDKWQASKEHMHKMKRRKKHPKKKDLKNIKKG